MVTGTRCRPTTPGQNANTTVTGQHQEDDRHHHQDLACGRPTSISARRPASRTSAAWACSTSASGVPRSTATAMPSANRATTGSPVRRGQVVEGRGRPACRCGPRPAPGPARRTARRGCGVPPGRARRPGPPRRPPPAPAARRRSGTPQDHAARACVDLGGQPVLAEQHAEREGDARRSTSSGTVPPGAARAPRAAPSAGGDGERRPVPRAPARPGTRATVIVEPGALEPAPDRRGAAEHPLDAVGRRGAAAGRRRRRNGVARRTGATGRRATRQVADVGQHPQRRGRRRRIASTRRSHQQQPGAADAHRGAPPHAAGVTRRIRRSAGSRPIRTISR